MQDRIDLQTGRIECVVKPVHYFRYATKDNHPIYGNMILEMTTRLRHVRYALSCFALHSVSQCTAPCAFLGCHGKGQ